MACIARTINVFFETGMAWHYIEVEGSATTIYEGIYQILYKPQMQKFVIHSVASGGNFHSHKYEQEVWESLEREGDICKGWETMYVTCVNGQECKILWLRKRNILKPFVDSYAKGFPPTFREHCCSINIYSIIMSCNGSSTIIHNFHCMLMSFALLLLVEDVMLCSSCYTPCWSKILIFHDASIMHYCNICHILDNLHSFHMLLSSLVFMLLWSPIFMLVDVPTLHFCYYYSLHSSMQIFYAIDSILYCCNIYHTLIDVQEHLRAKFHVPVPLHFLSGWETGDIIQKMGDVTHLMKGYFYVGCRFILISYFLTKFGE